MLALISISNMACGTDEAVSVPVCLDQISVENNTVLNAGDWSYGAGVNFRNATGFAMGSGVLLAEYKYPLIGVYNSHIKSVGGTVRPDDEIEDENLRNL